jgi:GNAT superfamily N-acetyltransferase
MNAAGFHRAVVYFRKNGLPGTLAKVRSNLQRSIFHGQMWVFSADLKGLEDKAYNSLIERKQAINELACADVSRIINSWDLGIGMPKLQERFSKGCSLWLARINGEIAGFVWSVPHKPVAPYFFPLMAQDVHLFDGVVLSEYRGRRILPAILNHILYELQKEGYERAFTETYSWNASPRKSLAKTPFRLIGVARKQKIFGRILVTWYENYPGSQ